MIRADTTEKIDNRYILISESGSDPCFATDLGQICKAYDSSRRSAERRYVSIMRLHDWCTLLPTDVLASLYRDVACAREVSQSWSRHPAIQAIVDAKLPDPDATPENGAGFEDGSDERALETSEDGEAFYVALTWVVPVREPAQLFDSAIRTADDVVQFIISLCEQLGALYRCTSCLRPPVAIGKLAFAPRVDGNADLILGDLGFDRFLDQPRHGPEEEREDVAATAALLTQLLDGILHAQAGTLASIGSLGQLRTDAAAVQSAWQERQAGAEPGGGIALWTLLGGPSASDFSTFGQDLARCVPTGLTLNGSEPGKPSDANGSQRIAVAQTAAVTRTAPPPSIVVPPAAKAASALVAVARDDQLVIRFIEGTNEFVLTQSLTEDIVLLGEQGLAFAPQSLDHFGSGQEQAAKLKEFAERLRRRRVYIQFHRNEATGTQYYTITDFEPPMPTERTVLNGQPLSPLFAALLTHTSVVEAAGGFRLELETSLRGHPAGWIIAQEHGVVALEIAAPGRYLTADPQATAVALPLSIHNPTNRVERLTIFVDGAPPDWPAAEPLTVPLFEKETAQRTYSLPLPATRLAGEYPLVVRLISDNIGAQVAAEAFRLAVPRQLDYAVTLQPESVRAGVFGELHVHNAGNFSRVFTINWKDRADELVFEPAQTTITMPPFYTGAISYQGTLLPRARRFIGGEKRHEFSITITPLPQNQGAAQSVRGQITSRAMLPTWIPVMTLLLAAGLFALYALLFPPAFETRIIEVDGTAVPSAIEGSELTLKWEADHTCLYSVTRNGDSVKSNAFNGRENRVVIANPQAGEEIDVKLRGCSLVRTESWVLPVVAAPLPPPRPPTMTVLSLHTQNVETYGPGTGGPENPLPPENQQILLAGQTGDLCIHWEFTEPYAREAFEIRIVTEPTVELIDRNGLVNEPVGDKCFPIAETFRDVNEDYTTPNVYYIRMATTEKATGVETESMETKVVQVFRPACQANASGPLYIREGPGRTFPPRGELMQGEVVFPTNSPLQLREQNDLLSWVPVTLKNDPRIGWIANEYLSCRIPIGVLPAASQIPATPTATPSPTPTPTPQPTATPQPTPQPTVSVAPQIINANDCAMLKWSIQGVKEVYLNGEGVAGESERQICPTQAGEIVFIWRIVGLDGGTTEKSVTLRVNGPLSQPTPPE